MKKTRRKTKTIDLQAGYIALIFGLLLFLAVAFFNELTIKVAVVALFIVLINVAAYYHGVLRSRIYVPLLALIAFVLMDGISIFYANYGKTALEEFLKIFGSFCIAIILLILSPKNEDVKGRWIGSVLAACTAIGCVISIDLLSTRLISGAFFAFFNLFSDYYRVIGGVEPGVRMTSVFSYPNCFAAFAGLGVLISLGLVDTTPVPFTGKKFDRVFPVILLFINSLGFILAFSMGAGAFLALAFLAYIVLQPGGRKTDLLVLMLETLIVCLPCVFLISLTSLQQWNGFQPVPILCTIFGSAALCLLHFHGGLRLIPYLKDHPWILRIVVAAVIVVACVYAAAALRLTGPAALAPGETLTRAIYPKPGTYSLSVDADTDPYITIESQTEKEALMRNGTILYEGDGKEASITVPEDSLVVFFNFNAPSGGTISSASIKGATEEYNIPLEYKLIPRFIARRLQSLRVNENALQRTVFFNDALKIFRKSPIIGSGMSAYQDNIRSVQPYYYVTKYCHNHYLETMVDTGVVGLILFLLMLGTAAVAVVKTLVKERKSGTRGKAKGKEEIKESANTGTVIATLTPALGASIIFMAGHAATDVDFSFFAFLPIAFGVLVMVNLCCGSALPSLSEKPEKIVFIISSVLCCIFMIFLVLNVYARNQVDNSTKLETLDFAEKLDYFEWTEASAIYTNIAAENYDTLSQSRKNSAEHHAARLAKNNIYDLIYPAAYYFATGRAEEAFDALEGFLDYARSDDHAWNTAFDLLRKNESEDGKYLDGVRTVIGKLDAWNEINWGKTELTEESAAFVERMRTKTGA